MTLRAKWIDEVWYEIFLTGAGFESFFFVFNYYFVVGNFDNFLTRNGKFWIDEAFDEWTFDDDLLNKKIIGIDGEIDKLTKFGTFFGFYGKSSEIKIEAKDLFDMDNFVWIDKLVDAIDDYTIIGILTDGVDVKVTRVWINKWASKMKGDYFEIVRVDNRTFDGSNGVARLNTENIGL